MPPRAKAASERQSRSDRYYEKNRSAILERKRAYNRQYMADKRAAHRRACRELLGSKCMDCGDSREWVLEFHHRDAATKLFRIGDSVRPLQRMLDEAAKCDLLCANCHLTRHYADRERDN